MLRSSLPARGVSGGLGSSRAPPAQRKPTARFLLCALSTICTRPKKRWQTRPYPSSIVMKAPPTVSFPRKRKCSNQLR